MTGAYTMLRNIAVSGFSVAIVVNEVRPPLAYRSPTLRGDDPGTEDGIAVLKLGPFAALLQHTDGDGIGCDCNGICLSFATANHASRFGRVCAQRNT